MSVAQSFHCIAIKKKYKDRSHSKSTSADGILGIITNELSCPGLLHNIDSATFLEGPFLYVLIMFADNIILQ